MNLNESIETLITLVTAMKTSNRGIESVDFPIVDLSALPSPPSEEEKIVKDFLRRQPVATIYMLLLTMYLGRGDFPVGDLLSRYEEFSDSFTKTDWAIDQMIGKGNLVDNLQNGRLIMSVAGEDLNSFDIHSLE